MLTISNIKRKFSDINKSIFVILGNSKSFSLKIDMKLGNIKSNKKVTIHKVKAITIIDTLKYSNFFSYYLFLNSKFSIIFSNLSLKVPVISPIFKNCKKFKLNIFSNFQVFKYSFSLWNISLNSLKYLFKILIIFLTSKYF